MPHLKQSKNIAIVYLITACFFAISMDVISKKLILNNVSIFTILFCKFFFGTVFYMIYMLIKKNPIKFKPNLKQEISRGLSVATACIAWIYGLSIANITLATLIVLMQPFFLICFARIILKEQIHKIKITIMLIAISILIFITFFAGNCLDNIKQISALALGTALFCLGDVITKKIIIKNKDSTTNTLYSMTFTTIPIVVFILIFGLKNFSKTCFSALNILVLLFLGLLNCLTSYFFVKAYKKADVNFLAVYKYSETFFGITADYFIFNNIPNKIVQLYGIFILPASIIIIIIDKIKNKNTPLP